MRIIHINMRAIVKIVFGLAVLFGSYFFTFSVLFPPSEVRMSEIIETIKNHLVHFNSLDIRTQEMLDTDPFKDLVNEVRPVVDELASLMSQTEIYEKMERIPGGPQQFMTSTTAALEILLGHVFAFEARYRLIVAAMNRNITGLTSEMTSLEGAFFGDIKKYDDPLQELKIYVGPDEGVTLPPVPITKVLRWLTELEKSYAEFEMIYPGMKIFDVLSGKIQGVITTVEQLQIVKNIHEILEKHGETTFSQILPFTVRVIGQVKDRMEAIFNHHNIAKERYENLVTGVDWDITSTKERIRNLAKRAPKRDEF